MKIKFDDMSRPCGELDKLCQQTGELNELKPVGNPIKNTMEMGNDSFTPHWFCKIVSLTLPQVLLRFPMNSVLSLLLGRADRVLSPILSNRCTARYDDD